MTYVVYRSQTSASLRRIPMWLVGSDGTSPATGESGGQPQINWVPRGTATVNTSGTLSLVSANAGEYYVELTASEVSALGAAKIHYRSANAIANSTPFEIVNYDSGDSMRLGQFALPNAAADASGGLPLKGTEHSDFTVHISDNVTYSGVTIRGIENYANISDVTLHTGTHTGAVIPTVTDVTNTVSANAIQISGDGPAADNLEAAFDGTGYDSSLTVIGVSGRVDSNVTIANADYSAVTVRVDSSVTIAGVTNVATQISALNDIDGSAVTLHPGTHSDATIQGISNYANISDVTLHSGTHTGAVIPTVTDVTNQVTADATAISGDAAAANNLEAAFDGTGYDSNLTVLGVSGRVDSNVTIANADYSAVTVRVDSSVTIAGVTNVATQISALNDIDGSAVTLHPGTHSDVTIQGVTRVNSSVTIANATYSEVTVRIEPLNYSGLTVGVDDLEDGIIVAATFAAGAVDAAALADDAGHEIADQILNRSIEGSADTDQRNVLSVFQAIRNRVQADASVLTVYQVDDTTSAWTASVTTVADPSNIAHINPR